MNIVCCASSSRGNLYSVECKGDKLIVDCGLSYKSIQKLLPFQPTEYCACIVDHLHGDHYNAKAAEELEKRGVPVFVGSEASRSIGGFEIKAFPVPHDIVNHGFIIRHNRIGDTLLFAVDCFYLPVSPNFSPNYIMLEANYARDLMKPGDSLNDRLFASHMSLEQCIKTLKSFELSQTREIHLLHLSIERSDEARFIREVQDATGVPTFVAPERRGK